MSAFRPCEWLCSPTSKPTCAASRLHSFSVDWNESPGHLEILRGSYIPQRLLHGPHRPFSNSVLRPDGREASDAIGISRILMPQRPDVQITSAPKPHLRILTRSPGMGQCPTARWHPTLAFCGEDRFSPCKFTGVYFRPYAFIQVIVSLVCLSRVILLLSLDRQVH